MELAERYQHAGVLGAAGKMGSGIALLLAQELGQRRLRADGSQRRYKLTLMDVDDAALDGLRRYLRAQLVRFAEKSTVALRAAYAERKDLVENSEIIQTFVDETLDLVRLTTDLGALAECRLVFEAVAENIDLKLKIFRQLNEMCSPETWFFTNTSSIPIRLLDEQAELNGRIVGFHFYNPPAVQRLLELITWEKTRPELVEAAKQITGDLRKKLFPANDIAGFIGNGHFIRDGLHGIAQVEALRKDHDHPSAVYLINRVTQEWLVRPMGIFQLIDYVGIDVFQCILGVMDRHIEGEELKSKMIDEMMALGIRGGQHSDGSQKDGFLRYDRGKITGVYCLDRKEYRELDPSWIDPLHQALGELPSGHHPWKALSRDRNKDEKLAEYFARLKESKTLGAQIALGYLKRSKEIGQQLLDHGVAQSADDVNGVLLNGFYHLYGPINEYV